MQTLQSPRAYLRNLEDTSVTLDSPTAYHIDLGHTSDISGLPQLPCYHLGHKSVTSGILRAPRTHLSHLSPNSGPPQKPVASTSITRNTSGHTSITSRLPLAHLSHLVLTSHIFQPPRDLGKPLQAYLEQISVTLDKHQPPWATWDLS
jgi:hypothetical protein